MIAGAKTASSWPAHEPATQWPRVGAVKQSLYVAQTRDELSGRVALRLPGHDDCGGLA